MDILWGAVALLLVVGTTTVALAVRSDDPSRPWFPAGTDVRVHGEQWDRDARRLDADLRAAASRLDVGAGVPVDPHQVAAEIVLRRKVPNPAVRDGVRGVPVPH
ncbi:hypothetical protein IF650_17085 [Cellulosimicrobium terreum]|nr:hypothetical protein [Cellulosimicrobium terreum]